jgi:hypothetical protein
VQRIGQRVASLQAAVEARWNRDTNGDCVGDTIDGVDLKNKTQEASVICELKKTVSIFALFLGTRWHLEMASDWNFAAQKSSTQHTTKTDIPCGHAVVT